MLSSLLALLLLGLAGLLVASVVLAVIGLVFSIAFGVAGLLLFKVAPLLLVGWVVLKLVERARPARRIASADREWLDS